MAAAKTTRSFSLTSSTTTLRLLSAIPNGVTAMSQDIEGLVESSTNLGVVKTEGARVEIVCCSRSSVMASLAELVDQHRAIGELAGAEVVQVYVSDDESSLPRPAKELKAFDKIELAPGDSAEVVLVLGDEAFSYYDPESAGWVLEPGGFTIQVGGSSRDIRARGRIEL